MSQETEIEKLVVRLMGDGSEYAKMLEEAEELTDELEQQVEELAETESELNSILNSTSEVALSAANAIDVIGQSMTEAGSAILEFANSAVEEFVDVGDTFDDLSARTGVSGQALSELQFAAEQSAQSLGDVENAIKILQRNLGKGDKASKDFAKALSEVGLTLKDLQGLSPEDQFTKVGDAVGKVEDHTKKASLSMRIFGRGGHALAPLLGNIEDLRKEAVELGLSFSDASIEGAGTLADEMNRLERVTGSLTYEIGAALVPDWLKFLEVSREFYVMITKWVKDNNELVRTIARIGMALVVVGTILTSIAGAIITFVGFLTALVGLQAILPSIIAMAGTVASVAGPILAVVAAVVALVTAISGLIAYVLWPEQVKSAWTSLTSFIGRFFMDMIHNAKVAFDVLVKVMGIIIGWISRKFMDLFTINFPMYAAQGIVKVINMFGQLSMSLVSILAKGINGASTELMFSLASALGGVTTGMSTENLGKSITDAVQEGMGKLKFPGFSPVKTEDVKETADEAAAAVEEQLTGVQAMDPKDQNKVGSILESIMGEARALDEGREKAKLYKLELLGVTQEMDEWKAASDALDLIAQKKQQMELERSVASLTESLKTQIETVGMSSDEVKVWELGQKGADEATVEYLNALNQVNEKLKDKEKLMKKGESVTDQYATAEEKFTKKYTDLLQLLDIGAIKQGTFDRALKEAEKDLKEANLKKEVEFHVRGLEAARAGTAEFKKLQEETLKFTRKNEISTDSSGLIAEAKSRFDQEKDNELFAGVATEAEIARYEASKTNGSSLLSQRQIAPNPAIDSQLRTNQDRMEELLDRIATATEETAEKDLIDVESLDL
jgi:ABC-type transporter Mla subunit MlaD